MRVYTGGTFDLFHHGHVRFLERCHGLGHVTVGLNRDEFVERYKGQRPVMSTQERFLTVESCQYVHKVIVNLGDEDSRIAILDTRPDLIVIGSDWYGKDYLGQLGISWDWLDVNGITLAFIPYTEGISTTELRERLR